MYSIVFKKSAEKDLDKIPNLYYNAIISKIKQLANNPHPNGCKKLVGRDDLWRVRAGDYRIIYCIKDEILIIEVINIGHRKDVYK